jgi:hypothetical protein
MKPLVLLSLIALPAIPLLAQTPLPALRKNGAVTQLFVDGEPFVMLAGELHNSSASSAAYMRPVWQRLSALNLNTVIGTVSWELLEPEEGRFDYALVDAQILEARRRNMRLVLIWFASWKNATSTYAPLWVKTNTRRFPRVETKPRPDLASRLSEFFASQMPMPNLSVFGEETLAADARAFRALMRHIKEVDPQHTVIMMQVENEAGLLGDSRDRSKPAEAAWSRPVPPELMNYLIRNKASLLPELLEVWGARGFRTSGTWAEVFGGGNAGDEIFQAWHLGRYIGRVIEAGKAELPLPMYVNAWLGPQPGMEQPGQYPSGGPVARVMDVWRAAAPAADLFAPDIYVQDFKETCALYARSGNPLFIPEMRAIAGNLFWALGRHGAIGVSPFGIEDVPEGGELAGAYRVLGSMMPVIAKAQAEGKILPVLMEGGAPETAPLAGYQVRVVSSLARVRLDAGQAPPDPGKAGAPQPQESPFGPAPETRPYGLVIATAPDEFFIVGSGMMVTFAPDSPGPRIAEIGSIDEGRFENGRWAAGRRLNGDEGRIVLRGGSVGLLRVRLYRRD